MKDAVIATREEIEVMKKNTKEYWYQQGRADQKKEDNEFFNFEGAWELEKQKVRAEVIAEISREMRVLYGNEYEKQVKLDGAREFAEWLPQHFDLRFSNNSDVWLDEFFNHTRDKVLAEWQKGKEND